MAVDTYSVYVGVYPSVAAARADYELVKTLHRDEGLIDDYDAAVLERSGDGKTKIIKKHEMPTRVGGGMGAGLGLAVGLSAVIFPFAALGGGLLAATTGGGALIGALAGHAAAGMSRHDIKELGELLDDGEAGLVVVAAVDMGPKVERVLRQTAEKVVARELKADTAAIAQAAKAVEATP
ncbi:DUF1269 domain-containing protein [Actinoplanes aureus]|uniref:DUF1269 domain-containing protein n=1 Tax=Actinoplanes aureus TaxID=2792083 RepID=A0A931CFS9_9ACTN|nr:DUF1269 domain-containing protein [Actinoplanes aureus]MBG0567197.1 DUF1269 domain-containing protein [Actinoplanes aureus]